MVKATTDSVSSALQAGRNRKAKASRGGARTGFFAAVLEKALNGPAAPGRAGKTKTAALPLRLKSRRAEDAEAGEKPRLGGFFEKRKLLKQRRESPETEALPRQEKPASDIVLASARAAASVSAEKTAKDLPQGTENPARGMASGESPGAAPAARAAVFPGTPGIETKAASPELLSAQETKIPKIEEKPRGGEKKIPAGQAAPGDARKPGREAGPKKTENLDAGDLLREVKLARAEEPKRDEAARDIEIRVLVRAGDERFEDSLRLQNDRSAKESASGLLRRMREEGNAHIVKSARFILKDKNEGEIRLVLKPPSLGEVRIRLSLQDNLIGGRIFVENDSVREVFERNMPELASAFRENGLEMGGMSVSVGNDGYRENETEAGGLRPPGFGGRAETETRPAAAYEYYFVSNAINLMV
ncbi:MAG: flagellar hook-length control protein FliK [Spirochaetia bacterium]|nr:flagellar hook-length control protein FliK [Spirochaetia bacterium]